MNLESDLKKEIVRIFQSHGIRYTEKPSLDTALVDYLTYDRKYIAIKKRKFILSKEVKSKFNRHPKAVDFIFFLEDVQNGVDLNPYQSDTLKQLRFHDLLLYNWKIHHFHLSNELDLKNGYFKKRSDHLIFALVTSEVIYLLDFEQHKEGIFGDEKWLTIIDTNWPWLLEKYKRKDIKTVYPQTTPSERQTLWTKGYSLFMTEANGSVFINPGLGNTTSGHSMEVIGEVNEIHRWLHRVNEWFKDNKQSLFIELSQKHNMPIDAINIKARISVQGIEVFDSASGEVIASYV